MVPLQVPLGREDGDPANPHSLLSPWVSSALPPMPMMEFSVRSTAPPPTEPDVSTALFMGSAHPEAAEASEQDGSDSEQEIFDVQDVGGSRDEKRGREERRATKGPFAKRKRSADCRKLPLTVEKAMLQLKEDLWGQKGVHKNALKVLCCVS